MDSQKVTSYTLYIFICFRLGMIYTPYLIDRRIKWNGIEWNGIEKDIIASQKLSTPHPYIQMSLLLKKIGSTPCPPTSTPINRLHHLSLPSPSPRPHPHPHPPPPPFQYYPTTSAHPRSNRRADRHTSPQTKPAAAAPRSARSWARPGAGCGSRAGSGWRGRGCSLGGTLG